MWLALTALSLGFVALRLQPPQAVRVRAGVPCAAVSQGAPQRVALGELVRESRAAPLAKRSARRKRGEAKERARQEGAVLREARPLADAHALPFEWLLVLDVEATCDARGRPWEHEIIEFPVVALNLRTLQVEHEFHSFVRPTANQTLTPFCRKLTGITQEQVDAAPPLDAVLREFDGWLRERGLVNTAEARSFAFGTDGHFDCQFFVDGECSRKGIPKAEYFDKWVNLKQLFADHYKVRRCKIAKMLERQGMRFEGRLHSGIDDSRNIARIAAQLVRDGSPVYINEGLPPRQRFLDL